jgi:hypothetical protein
MTSERLRTRKPGIRLRPVEESNHGKLAFGTAFLVLSGVPIMRGSRAETCTLWHLYHEEGEIACAHLWQLGRRGWVPGSHREEDSRLVSELFRLLLSDTTVPCR